MQQTYIESIKHPADQDTNEEEDELSHLNSYAGTFSQSSYDPDVLLDASWREVFQNCCVHTCDEWFYIALGSTGILFFLYFFLIALELLGNSAKILAACSAGDLFGEGTNPVSAVMIGLWSTALIQSSSTTTSIIVSLTGNTLTIEQSIYMIMGANVGTTITNTIVAMGQMGDTDQLERAFAGATVHDLFNASTLLVLFPLEVLTGYLEVLTGAMVKNVKTVADDSWEGPIKVLVTPIASRVILANKNLMNVVATGERTCAEYYPINCEDGVISYSTCKTGLIACDKSTNACLFFFDINATENDDQVSGGACMFLAVSILLSCLVGFVFILQKLLMGVSTRIIYKATSLNGYLGIAIGCGITILVQASSITTSVLTPLVGLGIIRLDQMYPLTLGANLGTPCTALMVAMVTEGIAPLQAALAHLFFNVTGVVLWYPIPFMRLPIVGARLLGKTTRLWRGFPLLYLFCFFFAIPGILFGISALFEQGKKGTTVLGVLFSCVLVFFFLILCCWLKFSGHNYVTTCFRKREKRRVTMENLPDDMDFLKAQVIALIGHTGLPEADEDEDELSTEDGHDISTEEGPTEDTIQHQVISVDVDDVSDEDMTEIIKESDSNEIQV